MLNYLTIISLYMLLSPFQKLPVYRIPSQTIPLESGNPQAPIWVIIYKHEIGPNHLAFLEKIFSSINKDLKEDIAIFTIPQDQTFRLPQSKLPRDKYIFCFGPTNTELGLNTSYHKYARFSLSAFSLIFCDDLTHLQSSPESKKQLWKLLKSIDL